jgi:hypothetical protein
MLMAFFMFAKWWKFTQKKTLSCIINIYFEFFLKMDKAYNDMKD